MPRGLNLHALCRGIFNRKYPGNLLTISFFSGLLLALLTGGALLFFSLRQGSDPAPPGDSFYRSLRDYDAAAAAGGDPEILNRMLNRLEEKTQGVESRLSVLKRRRALAGANPPYVPAYREAARKAAAAYPHSEPLAALAAGALIQGAAISGDTAGELKKYIPLLSSNSFSPLGLSLRILTGDLKNPQTAAAQPRLENLISAALPLIRGNIYPEAGEALITDLAILRLLRGDTEGASAEIQGGLYETRRPGSPEAPGPSPEFLGFAAEYFYDFGDPLRAAELFSRLNTEAGLLREADALWLARRPDSARGLWAILASPAGEPPPPESSPENSAAITARSLYNLAITAANTDEARALLERLIRMPPAASPGPAAGNPVSPPADNSAPDHPDQARKYGIILYSRLAGAPQSFAVLEQGLQQFPRDPLLDLELLRHHAAPASPGIAWEPGRIIGETWLLLGRHPEAEELYQWGAWYFSYQRRQDETAALLKAAARHHFDGPWVRLHQALVHIEEGDLEEAEKILRAIPPGLDWQAAANLGRILETLRSPAAALEYYETAAAAVKPPKEAARIQLRIARCLKALGKTQESRRVLEYALDLDPANLNTRLELRRLDNQTNF
jgi:tetratricopeptide (TPR) repeat protein